MSYVYLSFSTKKMDNTLQFMYFYTKTKVINILMFIGSADP